IEKRNIQRGDVGDYGFHLAIMQDKSIVSGILVNNESTVSDGVRKHITGVDKVFSPWMAFGGNTHDLGSFGEETDKITDLHQIHKEVLFIECGDGVTAIKRRRRDLSSNNVRDLATASGRG
ncbi:hypothetical protein Tco_0944719, partial [Tanacetum coccineum]